MVEDKVQNRVGAKTLCPELGQLLLGLAVTVLKGDRKRVNLAPQQSTRTVGHLGYATLPEHPWSTYRLVKGSLFPRTSPF